MHEIVLFSSPDEPDEPDDWRNDYPVNLVMKFKTSDETDFTDILLGQRIARITRNYFCFHHQMNLMNLMACAMIIWLIWLIW